VSRFVFGYDNLDSGRDLEEYKLKRDREMVEELENKLRDSNTNHKKQTGGNNNGNESNWRRKKD
jgi:hypothetical protein